MNLYLYKKCGGVGWGGGVSHAEKGEGVGGLTHTERGGGGAQVKFYPYKKRGNFYVVP